MTTTNKTTATTMARTILATRISLPISAVAFEATDNAPDAPDLDPNDYDGDAIVERVGSRYQIVDGFHRLSGLAGWAEGAGRSDLTVTVIDATGTDEDVIAAAAEPAGGENLSQDAAIEAIRSAAR